MSPRAELSALNRSILELQHKFLDRHLAGPPLVAPTRDEVLDVAAFGVLAHGHLENYFEGLAYWRLKWAVGDWLAKRPVRRATAALLLSSQPRTYSKATPTVFDGVRKALEEGKEKLSNDIERNHGIGMSHLHQMFFPLGVDVPSDPAFVASLDQLIKLRHHWAHQYRYGAAVVKPAADVLIMAGDCLLLAKELCRRVTTRASWPIHN